MKRQLQHFFHPLHLWCLCGGHGIWCFRLYERWVWQPLLRRLLTEKLTRIMHETPSQVSALLNRHIAPPKAKTFR